MCFESPEEGCLVVEARLGAYRRHLDIWLFEYQILGIFTEIFDGRSKYKAGGVATDNRWLTVHPIKSMAGAWNVQVGQMFSFNLDHATTC